MRLDLPPTEPLARDRVAETNGERTFSLLVVRDGETSTYPLAQSGKLLIGRAASADVRVDHASVSREHAALHLGESLRIEDLGSANGTRVRDLPLQPGAPVEIFPDDVVDLGAVLLVVQYRRMEQRLRRSCDQAFFDLRLEEECELAASSGASFALAELEVEGGLGPHAVQLLLAAELQAEDLITSSGRGKYQILWPGIGLEEAEIRAESCLARLAQRGLSTRVALKFCPRDGRTSSELCSRVREQPPRQLGKRSRQSEFVIVDQSMQRVYKLLERVAESELSVILLGESGVGKELCAELVHATSARAGKPFLRLNCAALAETLLESELFGHERGAFTGAISEKVGLLEAASGGTLFLDEVGEMPLAIQIKLLRVLEAREVLRVGSRQAQPIDIRVIAATNQDLNERITSGLFREDLYYRLNGISVIVPPLRERVDDIEPLARHFLARFAKPGQALPTLPERSIDVLEAHTWPGNVRELRNLMQRALVLCDGPAVEPEHLPLDRTGSSFSSLRALPRAPDLRDEVKRLERGRIEQALADCQGNQRRAAERLGLSRGALLRRLELLQIARPRKGS